MATSYANIQFRASPQAPPQLLPPGTTIAVCCPDAAWCDFFVYTLKDWGCERIYQGIAWQQLSVPQLEQ